MKATCKNDIIKSLILLFDKQQVLKLPFKKLTEALELIPKTKGEQTLNKLSKESVEEFA